MGGTGSASWGTSLTQDAAPGELALKFTKCVAGHRSARACAGVLDGVEIRQLATLDLVDVFEHFCNSCVFVRRDRLADIDVSEESLGQRFAFDDWDPVLQRDLTYSSRDQIRPFGKYDGSFHGQRIVLERHR